MKVIGVTGGVGCGKSTVLEIIRNNFNAYIINADDVARTLMEVGAKGYTEVVAFFGTEILDSNREIDRVRLADIVFSNPNKRMVLNSIIHPLVKSYIVNQITELKIMSNYDYIFVEAALLLEDHYDVFLDEIWYIYAPEEIRRERLYSSRGYTKARVDGMIKSQMTEEEFRDKSDVVIDNGKSIEETKAILEKLIET